MLNDKKIRLLAKAGMIEGFVDYDDQPEDMKFSYGLSSCGYDLRLGNKFIDAGDFEFTVTDRDTFAIGPGEFVLGYGVETIRMPRYVSAICVGKSTLARNGIHVLTTPIEPEWHGQVTIEIVNLSRKTYELNIGQGIAQLQFYQCGNVERSYADKKGKYQNQTGVTKAI